MSIVIMANCATAEHGRRTLVDELNRWLGQYKDARIVQVGAPSQCMVGADTTEEIYTWATNEGQVAYRYDQRGVARFWSYTGRHFGVMDSGQNPAPSQQPQASAWQSLKDLFRGMNVGPAIGGSAPTSR